jgi:hypothetical protein
MTARHGGHSDLWNYIEGLRVETGQQELQTDQVVSELLLLVVALEEVLAARWPRSILARRRWRRDVRASVRHIQGRDFTRKRTESLATGWVTRDEARARWTPGGQHSDAD